MFEELLNLIQDAEVEKACEAQIWESLVGDEPGERLARAKTAACAWVYALLKKCGMRSLPEEIEILREALIKRTLYELAARNEVEPNFEDKKEEARELLEGLLGPCVESKKVLASLSYDPKDNPY